MTRAERLLKQIDDWKTESPRHEEFGDDLTELVQRIAAGFKGKRLAILLAEAELSFERQRELHSHLNAAATALEEITRAQRELSERLFRIGRETGSVTLH